MKITKQEYNQQNWMFGHIISDGSLFFMIAVDHDGKYHLVNLETGRIFSRKYDTMLELKNDNGDFEPISHAEIIYGE